MLVSATVLAAAGSAGGGTLHNHVDYPLGQSGPQSIAIGDLNGDGKPDIVVANGGTPSVSVLLNQGDGTFTVAAHYAIGSGSYSLAIGDLNGDGKLDLAVANFSSSNVSVLLGHGDGTFATHVDYAVGSGPHGIAIGDLNGDGKADLAVANESSSSVSVLLGNGDGTFAAHSDSALGTQPLWIAIGDVNGDGRPDVVTANYFASSVSVLLGNGDGSLSTHADFSTGSGPTSVAIGDVNGDGKADLATANQGGSSVSLLLGHGDGTFAAHADFATGSGPRSVAIGDLNGDGSLDLATANSFASNMSVLLGNGEGSFATHVDSPTGSSAFSVAIGDLNGDGKPDVAIANSGSGSVSVLLGDATPPAVTCSPFDGLWHRTQVSLTCSATDDFSGLADSEDFSNFQLTTSVPANTETANAFTNSFKICDNNNNCANAGPIGGIKVDRKGPGIDIQQPLDGAVFLPGTLVRAKFTCWDPGSGVSTCGADQPSGTRLDTSHEGDFQFQVNAWDNVDNMSSQTVGYTVMAAPAPTKLTPSVGAHGTVVAISGTHLEHVTSVYFVGFSGDNDQAATFVAPPTSTTIKVTVPGGAISGELELVNAAATRYTPTFLVKPAITNLTPKGGSVDTPVEIDGYGFDPNTITIKFGGVAATTFTVDSANVLHANVPAGAHTGAVTVTTPGGTATSAFSFSVIPTAPRVSAKTAHSGTALTISGTGLTDMRSVTFRGVDRPVRASYMRISSTQLRVVVPNGARTGAATVTTAGGSAQTPVITITG